MLDLANAGIFWVVSEDPTQQKLLKWSIQLAKRHYPELPRCVATTDSSLKVDADTISFIPRQSDPKIESALQISLSPFERTIYLCCRSMILHRFEHLLQQCEFEGHCQPIADHPYLNHWIRPIHAWLSSLKKQHKSLINGVRKLIISGYQDNQLMCSQNGISISLTQLTLVFVLTPIVLSSGGQSILNSKLALR